jgi:hypothetical protein
VPTAFIGKEYVNAVNSARAYKRNFQRKVSLENLINQGVNVEENKQELFEIEEALRLNPAIPLVKEGLLPSIVDELSEAKEHSAKDSLMDKFLPESFKQESKVKDVFNEVLMNEGSKIHDFLSEVMEMGDFGAKYVLYQWETQNGVNAEEALNNARVEFINYGTLTGQTQEYLNKMGILSFFKYYQRSQAIMLKNFRRNPTRSLLTIGGLIPAGVPNIYEAFLGTKDLSYTTGPVSLLEMAANAAPVNQIM